MYNALGFQTQHNPVMVTFLVFIGFDIFGPEREIRNHLKSMEFEYQCGNFKSS